MRPDGPSTDLDPVPPPMLPAKGGGSAHGRAVLLGEMCPEAAAGRPGIAPLMVHGVQWSDDAEAVADPIERGVTSQFSVLGYDGVRVGVFEPLGAADAGLPQDVAAGTYVGASACTRDTGKGTRAEDTACNQAMRGCGLAIAAVGSGSGGEPAPVIEVGGACMAGDQLIVDIDNDGQIEAFPITGFLDSGRAPADEVSAAPQASATCTARFSVYGLKLAPGSDPGQPVDPRYQVDVDILGVVDLDGDGRREIAIALRYPDSRTIVLYSAPSQATRLEQVGESVSWPRP